MKHYKLLCVEQIFTDKTLHEHLAMNGFEKCVVSTMLLEADKKGFSQSFKIRKMTTKIFRLK
jgi:hypothetical protein